MLLCLKVEMVDVQTYPTAPEGLHVLKRLPSGPIFPDGFVKDSHTIFNQVLSSVKSHFADTASDVVEEWENWGNTIPRTDNALLYCLGNTSHMCNL